MAVAGIELRPAPFDHRDAVERARRRCRADDDRQRLMRLGAADGVFRDRHQRQEQQAAQKHPAPTNYKSLSKTSAAVIASPPFRT